MHRARAVRVEPGDEVICPRTPSSPRRGRRPPSARPVFADIDPATSTSTRPRSRRRSRTGRGRSSRPPVRPARRHARAARPGRRARPRRGRGCRPGVGGRLGRPPVGTFGDAATFCFFPTKNLPGVGDGGIVPPRSADVADRVRMLRFHGSRQARLHAHRLQLAPRRDPGGGPARVPAAGPGLERGPARSRGRRYAELGLGELVELPREARGPTHVYHLYVVRAADRDVLVARRRRRRRRRRTTRCRCTPARVRRGLPAGRPAGDRAGRARGPGAADVPDARRGPAARGRRGGAGGGAGRGQQPPLVRVWSISPTPRTSSCSHR